MLNSDFTVMEDVVIASRIIATLAKSRVADPDLLLSFSDPDPDPDPTFKDAVT